MRFGKQVELKNFSSIRIGGIARNFVRADSVDELIDALRTARQIGLPVFILGGGTNILWSDHEFDGVVIQPNISSIEFDGCAVTAGAGVLMPELVETTVGRGLAGLEWAGGLPGSFAGAIFGNAGCFGGEMKDRVVQVVSLDMDTLEVKTRTGRECAFAYRMSVFKARELREIILYATLLLRPGEKRYLYEAVQARVAYRKARHPLEYPNIGSIFKNVPVGNLPQEIVEPHRGVIKEDPFPVIPTAYLVERARLKGAGVGGAIISPKHPNFIVNVSDARASDVLELIAITKERVRKQFDIELEEEVRIVDR